MTGRADQSKGDLEKVQGTWSCVSGKISGTVISEPTVHKLKLVMTEQEYTSKSEEETLFSGAYELDPTANPKTIDIMATEGENKGKAAKGIYSLEGDNFRLCYTMSGQERPPEFVSKPGSGVYLVVWKRAKA